MVSENRSSWRGQKRETVGNDEDHAEVLSHDILCGYYHQP